MQDIKTSLSEEALKIVTGARRSAYGKPENNFERIARLWNAHIANTDRVLHYKADVYPSPRSAHLDAADVATFCRFIKEARLAETPNHRDSFVDIIGYTLCQGEMALDDSIKELGDTLNAIPGFRADEGATVLDALMAQHEGKTAAEMVEAEMGGINTKPSTIWQNRTAAAAHTVIDDLCQRTADARKQVQQRANQSWADAANADRLDAAIERGNVLLGRQPGESCSCGDYPGGACDGCSAPAWKRAKVGDVIRYRALQSERLATVTAIDANDSQHRVAADIGSIKHRWLHNADVHSIVSRPSDSVSSDK